MLIFSYYKSHSPVRIKGPLKISLHRHTQQFHHTAHQESSSLLLPLPQQNDITMPTTRKVLENVFGLLGIFFWSFQLLPQVIDNYRSKTTKGLSSSMFILWTLAALGFGSYAIIEGLSVPIIVQPHVFGFFSTICYLQCFYYGQGPGVKDREGPRREGEGREVEVGRRNMSLRVILGAGMILFLVLGGLEAGAYFATIVSCTFFLFFLFRPC